MEFHLLHIVTFLFLTLVTSHATQVNEVYWNTMLNNAPMPKAVKDLLKSEDQKASTINNPLFDSHSQAAKDLYMNDYGLQLQAPFSYSYDPPPGKFEYGGRKTYHMTKNDRDTTVFFLEQDLYQGKNMTSQFTTNNAHGYFLPRKIADSIPFSSQKVPEILKQLSINPNLIQAQMIRNTIANCEKPGIKQEEKLCVTSLESMINFVISKLGKNVEAISTDAGKSKKVEKYSISGLKTMSGIKDENVVCHTRNYPYAVFNCHKTYATKAYMVSLRGVNGGEVEAVAVCHQDTSPWDPRHMAFELLNVKPGTLPICHFLPEGHVVWFTK